MGDRHTISNGTRPNRLNPNLVRLVQKLSWGGLAGVFSFIENFLSGNDVNSPVPLIPDGRILASYLPAPRIWSSTFFSFSRKFMFALLALKIEQTRGVIPILLYSSTLQLLPSSSYSLSYSLSFQFFQFGVGLPTVLSEYCSLFNKLYFTLKMKFAK